MMVQLANLKEQVLETEDLVLNATDASGSDAGDRVILDGTDSSSSNAGDGIDLQDDTFGLQQILVDVELDIILNQTNLRNLGSTSKDLISYFLQEKLLVLQVQRLVQTAQVQYQYLALVQHYFWDQKQVIMS